MKHYDKNMKTIHPPMPSQRPTGPPPPPPRTSKIDMQIENLSFHDGYIRTRDIATEMAVSLHQVFHTSAATLRFKMKDSKFLIVDIQQDAFDEFMKINSKAIIPWYLRWWYWLKTKKAYQGRRR